MARFGACRRPFWSLQETGTVPWGVGVGVGAVGCPEGKYQIAQLLRYQAINTRSSRCWSSHLGSSWVNPETIPVHRGQGETQERGSHPRWGGGRLHWQRTSRRPVLGAAGWVDLAPTQQNLNSLRRGLSSVQVVLAAFTLSRLCPWHCFYCGNSGHNIQPKDRGGCEGPPPGQGVGGEHLGPSLTVERW